MDVRDREPGGLVMGRVWEHHKRAYGNKLPIVGLILMFRHIRSI